MHELIYPVSSFSTGYNVEDMEQKFARFVPKSEDGVDQLTKNMDALSRVSFAKQFNILVAGILHHNFSSFHK